jgi:homogentisate 1,2-dioxygenase
MRRRRHYLAGHQGKARNLAFMFETSRVLRATSFAASCAQLQPDDDACRDGLGRMFTL